MGKIEAFHKTIQRELLTTTEFSDIEEARLRIHDYIMFYNFARPHMGIDNKAPAERYFKNLMPYNHDTIYYRRVAPYPQSSHGQSRRDSTVKRGKSKVKKGKQGFTEKRVPSQRIDWDF